ncbi:MAG: competence/damage-inducible protein A [Candidatus Eremiobacterales bacterium]|jgi:nicotinamide-nucleotide amidase
MPSAEIITIGTELLLGQLVDTNTSSIARALAACGVDVHRETSVGDNEQRIAAAVREALGRSDIAICAGGLGPTVDDLTREAVAAAFERPLVLHEPSLAYIEQRFAQAGWAMAPNNRRQAMVPAGAVVLDNPHGSAPGFVVDDGRRIAIALPGPPAELDPMLQELAIPWLVKRFDIKAVIVTRVLHTLGIGESDLDERIADLFRDSRNPSIAVLARPGFVDVKITAKAQDAQAAAPLIASLEAKLRERLGDSIYATDDGSFEQSLGEALRARGWSIGVAESCTGGLIAAAIASVPGASDYFKGGVIAYADDVKSRLLGVDRAIIAKHGAVSEEVARAMAVGAREHLHATLAVSTTGVAGPGGGTPDKPVGLVFVALARPGDKTTVRRLTLPGTRGVIQRRATVAALSMAWKAAR